MRIALTIAGSDSGGGAGIQADLKTFHQFGVFGTTVITAITAQNTVGVREWQPVPTALVRAQLDAVIDDLRPAALKSGMLGARAVVREVAAGIREHGLDNYVLDPVMVATSGDVLLEPDAISAVRDELVPLCGIVTPNREEAALLLATNRPIRSADGAEEAAERLVREFGASAALVKGGHAVDAELVDVLFANGRGRATRFAHPRLDTRNTHGTGCALSAAIAASLALGASIEQAVETAVGFVHRAIADAPGLGSGHGPINHFVQVTGTGRPAPRRSEDSTGVVSSE